MTKLLTAVVAFTALAAACGSNSDSSSGVATDNVQLPPTTDGAAVEAWLAKSYYKNWTCEAAPHDARSPSPHAVNRICVNDKIAKQPAGPGEYPVGAAAVKELYDGADASSPGTIAGYAVEVHISAGTDTSNWYWYERNPTLKLPAAAYKNGQKDVAADGVGPNEGTAGTPTEKICTGCHMAAGSDAQHNTTDSHDFVYTHVP